MKHSSPSSHRAGASGRRAARGTLQLMLGRMALFTFGYIVTIVLARGLGPVDYGIYGIILSVLVWAEQIGRFGVPEAITKLIPENDQRARGVENTSQTILLIVSLILFVSLWIATPLFTDLFQIPDGSGLFRLAILDIPVSGIYFAYQGILTGQRNFAAVSAGLAVYGLSKLVAVAVAWLLGLSLFSALVVNILGTVGALLFLATQISFRAFRFSFVQAGTILHLAFPIGLCLLASQVLVNLDLWSLKISGAAEAATIGYYVASLNIARVPAFAFSVVNGIVLPSVSLALARQDMPMARRYVQGAARFLWVTLLPSSVLLVLTADELMVLLYSSRYASGGLFLPLQACAFALFGVTQVFNELLIARGNPRLTAGVALSHIPVSVLLNIVLIPWFGALGAATALLLTALSTAAMTAFLVFQRFGSLMERSTFIKPIVAAAVMVLVSTQLLVTGPLLLGKYLFLLAVYGAVLFIVRELTWYDLQPLVLWGREQG